MTQAQVINRPEADDLEVADVDPRRELEACNHLLADRTALDSFYAQNGYILLRGVLDLASVQEARDAMLAVAAKLGLVEPGDATGRWTGKSQATASEESDLYAGIARRLVEHPANLAVMEAVQGEPACAVPIVQYRAYPPGGPTTSVHQDGFYSPGIQDYRPVWITLTPCLRDMGGLALAIGQNQRGYFHNVGKPSPFPIPRDAIPDDSWASTDYMPGDVLIVHPATPHCGMPNRSDRLRITLDTRIQSAANPSALAVAVTSVTPSSLEVEADGLGKATFSVDAGTFIRVLDPGIREPFDRFAEYTKPGMRLVLVRDGDRAVMLRKAAEG